MTALQSTPNTSLKAANSSTSDVVPNTSAASNLNNQDEPPKPSKERIFSICDGCGAKDITANGGVRYHCLSCHDYDLCKECHASDVTTLQHTAEHIMQMLTDPPDTMPNQTPEHILQERAAKSLSKSTTKKSSKPLSMTCHKILHVFLQVNELIMDPFKVKEMIDSISMDGMRWGEKDFRRAGMEWEYVLHFTHNEEFSVCALQEKVEELEEYVVYTYVDDPDEDARDYALWCHTNGSTSATQPFDVYEWRKRNCLD